MVWNSDNYGNLEEQADAEAERQEQQHSMMVSMPRFQMQGQAVSDGMQMVGEMSQTRRDGTLERSTTACCVTRILMCEEPYGFEFLGRCS